MRFAAKKLQLLLLIIPLAGIHTQASAATREIKWVGCGISKLGFMKELAAAYEKKSGTKIVLEGGGATKGLRSVASGKSQLGGSCRLPLVIKNSDGTYTIEHSEQTLTVIPVGWDSLVVITNKANKAVTAISEQQLRDVLTGKITNWKSLGGNDQPINLYVRSGKISGVGRTLRQQLFNNTQQEFRQEATRLASSGKIEKAVEKDPNALAVSGISSSRRRNVNMLKLDGIAPSLDTLEAGKYPLFRLLFLVAPHNLDKHPELQGFVKYAASPQGQAVIKKAGTLPYSQAMNLMFTGAQSSYLHSIDLLSDKNIYSLNGK